MENEQKNAIAVAEIKDEMKAIHARIDDLLAKRGDADETLAAFGREREIMERLAGLYPANADRQRAFAVDRLREEAAIQRNGPSSWI